MSEDLLKKENQPSADLVEDESEEDHAKRVMEIANVVFKKYSKAFEELAK